jgi:hypothetical protein
MRLLLVALVAAVWAPSLASAAEVRLGAELGLQINTLSEGYEDTMGGPHGGLGIEIGLADNLSLQTGAMYAQKGGRSKSLNTELRLDYIHIPALVEFSRGVGKPYAAAGLSLGVNLGGTAEDLSTDTSTDISDSVEAIDLALVAGVGGSFSIGNRSSLSVGIQYSLGLTDVLEGSDAKTRAITVVKVGLTF